MIQYENTETPYRYETVCQRCNTRFTAPVRQSYRRPPVGDYIGEWEYDIPSWCPDCEDQRHSIFRRKIDLADASLPWWDRIRSLIHDPAPEPRPSQDEQVDILLEILDDYEDPMNGGIDWYIIEPKQRRVRPFWWGRIRLNDEYWSDLKQRAREAYDVDVDILAVVGSPYTDVDFDAAGLMPQIQGETE